MAADRPRDRPAQRSHLVAATWWNDQLRQNELSISDDIVLRFPSVVTRCEEPLVVDQLRRALGL